MRASAGHLRSTAGRRQRPAPLAATAIAVVLASALPAVLGGCGIISPLPTNRGQLIEPVDYAKLSPGTSTRDDVQNLLGSPTAHATFDDNTWFYIGEVTAPVPMSRPSVQKQEVVELKFDSAGVLRSVRRLNKQDGTNVAMTGRTTPSPGSDTSIMQQLIGNVGRYSPMGMDSLGGIGGSGGLGSNNGYGHGGQGNTLP
ncbi:outer membrane protein assembly factor BamE [Rhizosaccharibacter radicis]|uniref:Outer membrane protein assembly factor BamE n=1 Tax=Rhizosaccharibacter radicis TaxID=2782605 RepID=A0ABT1VYC5_9PROT|nr:outer membrane protein assembly factor BamE [Acetobacteraceae bacterium KSS12]